MREKDERKGYEERVQRKDEKNRCEERMGDRMGGKDESIKHN